MEISEKGVVNNNIKVRYIILYFYKLSYYSKCTFKSKLEAKLVKIAYQEKGDGRSPPPIQ